MSPFRASAAFTSDWKHFDFALSDGVATFVYGPGGLPIEQVDGAGNVLNFHHDQLGSTRALSDASGTVVGMEGCLEVTGAGMGAPAQRRRPRRRSPYLPLG